MARAVVARAAALAGGAADRYACGKLKPTHPPTVIKRIVDSAVVRGENPLLGTPIGWLLLHHEITSKQASAGIEYGRLRASYDRLMGLPRRSARLLGDCAPSSRGDDAAIRRNFESLREKLCALVPPGARAPGTRAARLISILDDTCVDLQMPSWADQIVLRAGLDAVADFFRIGTKAAA